MSILRVQHDMTDVEALEAWEAAYEACKRLRNTSIIYRGYNPSSGEGGFFKVIEDRQSFRGASDSNVKALVAALMKRWSFKASQPVFATFQHWKAKFFGNTYIMIPLAPFTSLQNPEVDDILTYMAKYDKQRPKGGTVHGTMPNKDMDAIVNSYQRTLKDTVSSEVIFDSREYYLLALPENWLNLWLPHKWHKKSSEIKTYAQLADLLGKVVWLKKKQLEKSGDMKKLKEGDSPITAKGFKDYVDDEYDVEILDLLIGVINQRKTLLTKMQDMSNPRMVVKGFQMNKQDLKEFISEGRVLKGVVDGKPTHVIEYEGQELRVDEKDWKSFKDMIELKESVKRRKIIEATSQSLGSEVISMLHEIASNYNVKVPANKSWTSVAMMVESVYLSVPKSDRSSFIKDIQKLKAGTRSGEIIL